MTTILKSHFIDDLIDHPHYKDYFSSDKVMVLIAEFYCTYLEINTV